MEKWSQSPHDERDLNNFGIKIAGLLLDRRLKSLALSPSLSPPGLFFQSIHLSFPFYPSHSSGSLSWHTLPKAPEDDKFHIENKEKISSDDCATGGCTRRDDNEKSV